ncbi:MAG TPA: TM2 domain-containing protein, partial [Candidatus Baltobacteraceae bacterium]|nr:TM2 domain-containing protein [Candidatus Baltobacteraceae bacterium]
MEQNTESVPRSGTVVPAVSDATPSSRSRLRAGVLGIFLGAFGIHRFYLGYTTIGIIQLVLTLMSFGFVGLWGVVEGILILAGVISKDVHGRTLEFDGDTVAGETNPGVREPRSRLVAAILAFFLGAWGIHRFYLGYTKIGLLQLSMTLAGLAITVLCEIVVAWRLLS